MVKFFIGFPNDREGVVVSRSVPSNNVDKCDDGEYAELPMVGIIFAAGGIFWIGLLVATWTDSMQDNRITMSLVELGLMTGLAVVLSIIFQLNNKEGR